MTIGERSLARFGTMLMLVIPLALLLATLGGYWPDCAPCQTATNTGRLVPFQRGHTSASQPVRIGLQEGMLCRTPKS